MPTELKRGTIRLASNYGRLATFLVFGILFVPIFIYGVGMEAFGILGLLGSSMGIAEMCQTIVRQSMNRELAAAYHSREKDEFARTYNSALILAAGMAALTGLLFVLLYLLLPLFNISDHLRDAAGWVVIAKGGYSVITAMLGPALNVYLVTERMVLHNTWFALRRGTDLFAAVLLFLVPGWVAAGVGQFNPLAAIVAFQWLSPSGPGEGLTAFAFLSAGGSLLIAIVAIVWIVRTERRLIPRLSMVNRESVQRVLGTAGWNTVVVTAMNLHIRIDQIIMNLAFGGIGNAVFTLGVRLTSYIWQAAGGAVEGLDVVSARVSTATRTTVAELMRHATRLQAAITIPAGLLVVVLAEPIMKLWVGRHVDDPAHLDQAIVLAQILAVGMIARSIAESWQRVLYGAGHIREYAPMVLLAGVLNPVIAVLLIVLFPEAIGYKGPAIAFAAVFVIFHFFWLPRIAAKCLGVRLSVMLRPLARPAVAAVVSGSVLLLPRVLGAPDSLALIVPSVAVFGVLHAGLCWFFVLNAAERHRIASGLKRQAGALPAQFRPGSVK